jgi:hypothetical protein
MKLWDKWMLNRKQKQFDALRIQRAKLNAKINGWKGLESVKGGGLPRSVVEDIIDMKSDVAVIDEKLRQLTTVEGV